MKQQIKKRGQISIILIIVIIMLILFLLFISFKNNVSVKKDVNVGNLIDIQKPVKMYVQSCLGKALDDGLTLLGKQGGVIFESQGGKTPDSLKYFRQMYGYNHTEIFAPIDMRSTGGMTCQPYIPNYYQPYKCPSVAYPFKGINSPIIDYDEKAELPNNFRIMNRVFFHGLFNKDETFYMNSDWKKTGRNIYYSLQSFMEKNITYCLNLADLKNQGILVKALGNLSIIPVFSERGTGALMNYPLTAENNGYKVKLSKFYVESPKKLFSIYKFLYSDLRKEARDFTYNLSAHQPSEMGYNDLRLNLSIDVDKKNDLLIISQMLNGRSIYNYYQIIYNSPPAMSYIHYKDLSVVHGLIDNLIGCFSNPDLNPWEAQKHLSAGIGKTISMDAIGCIYKGYYNLASDYSAYTDPDGDACSMSFKVGNCGWNAPCDLKGPNLVTYPTIPLIIKFTDGQYEDYQNMTINLIDHSPIGIGGSCTQKITLPTERIYNCEITAIDTDVKYGKDVDELTLTSINPKPEKISKSVSQSQVHWHLIFKNPSSGSCSFTVTDKYGKSSSKSFTIT